MSTKKNSPRRQSPALLPPYDAAAACPKCASQTVATRYCPAPDMTMVCGTVKGLEGEHMHRTCERCGHEWLQACLPQ